MAIPRSDTLLAPYATNFQTRIAASPATFQLQASQATALTAVTTPYLAANEAVVEARESGTRSKSLTAARRTAKLAFLAVARPLYDFIQSNSAVSDADKALLGVHVRQGASPVPVPNVAPVIVVESVVANVVKVVLRNPQTGDRGKPSTAGSISIYSHVGPTAPNDPTLMKFEGNTTNTKATIEFPVSLEPFTKVWLSATYNNPRGLAGPGTVPVATNLGTWAVQDVAAQSPVRIAA